MQIQTHYKTLGLAPIAPIPVLRAAYRALALIYHTDRTIHLPASERASHSAIFRSVQEAFDVLGNASLKASYDFELAHHHGAIGSQNSTFHHSPNTPRQPSRRPSIRLATPEAKAAMKAKTEVSLAQLRAQRTARDLEEANLRPADLKFMLKTWKDLGQENKRDAVLLAHCAIMMHEYEVKIIAEGD